MKCKLAWSVQLFAQIQAFSSMELSQNEIVGYFDGIKHFSTSKNAETELVSNGDTENTCSTPNAKSLSEDTVSILNAEPVVNFFNTVFISSLTSRCSSVDEYKLLPLKTGSLKIIELKNPYIVDLVTKGFKLSFLGL